MKKLLIILACVLTLTANSTTRPRLITVTGNILHEKNITFTLYEVDSIGNLKELESSQVKKDFYVRCYTKTKYVLKFEGKKKTKYMEFEIKIHKNVEVDVDFSKDNSIVLECDGNGLSIRYLKQTLAVK